MNEIVISIPVKVVFATDRPTDGRTKSRQQLLSPTKQRKCNKIMDCNDFFNCRAHILDQLVFDNFRNYFKSTLNIQNEICSMFILDLKCFAQSPNIELTIPQVGIIKFPKTYLKFFFCILKYIFSIRYNISSSELKSDSQSNS